MPSRDVICADALAWLRENRAERRTSVITSLPDVSELPDTSLDAWRTWFMSAAAAVFRFLPADGVAIFFQSDIFHGGVWIDKGYLVMQAAEREGMALLWHKIACRLPPGTRDTRRPSYAHMLCFAHSAYARAIGPRSPGPDVLADAGPKSWSKAMGETACVLACDYVREIAGSTSVVDPFCGRGTTLAVANAQGLHAVGVDLSSRCCRAARKARRAHENRKEV